MDEITKQINNLWDTMRRHQHKGTDFTTQLETAYVVRTTIPGTQAATATNYSVIDNVPFPVKLIAVYESHTTAGSDSNSVSLQIEKLSTTQALDSGTLLLASNFSIGTVVVAGGGAGYAINDTVTLTGGTASVQAILLVTAVLAGAITAVSIQNAETYSVFPANPVAQGSSSGAGVGATFTITYTINGFNLKSTANVIQTGSLTTTKSSLVLLPGDRIGLKDIGSLTAVAGVCVTMYFLRI